MNFYLRLIQDSGPETYSIMEQHRLHDCLASAPSVEAIKELKQHPKGGYSVTMERASDSIDSLISHIVSHGYRAVI